MKTSLNAGTARSRAPGYWRVTWLLIVTAMALVATILWLAPVRSVADSLDTLPPTGAVGVDSKPTDSGPSELPLHAGTKLDALTAEPDPSPAAVAAYER